MAYSSTYTQSHALIIGIGEYADPAFQGLPGAVKDARDMARVLADDPYGFTTRLLIDGEATKTAIQDALNDLQQVDPDSRTIVYFAGHGENLIDRFGREYGIIFAHDSEKANRFSALNLDEVTGLRGFTAGKHLLFIFDSCFGGKALGMTNLRSASDRYIEKAAFQVLTGGAVEVVVDERSMTRALLKLLENPPAAESMRLTTLYPRLQSAMELARAVQTPQAGHLDGSEGGDFVFYVPTIKPLWADLPEELAYLGNADPQIRLFALGRVPDFVDDPDVVDSLAEVLTQIAADDADQRVRDRAGQILADVEERLEQERLEQERLEQERLEQDRLEQDRLEQDRLEQDRSEQEQAQEDTTLLEFGVTDALTPTEPLLPDELPSGWVLKVTQLEGGESSEFKLEGSYISVGRQPGNDLVLNSFAVSRYHAQFSVEGDQLFVIDLGGLNGTYVNDELIEADKQVALKAGDVILIGDFSLEVTGRPPD